jgi:LAO/AO transport system kinase
VGIIAVDPTSPFTGGAILGDRIRMLDLTLDAGVFIRSMGTRGSLGGLSKATANTVKILDAAGMDVIFIETVGVGQSEVDIVKAADTTLVVLVPGLGDDIQAIKAGILEIGDIFNINKADREGVERLNIELETMLDLNLAKPTWRPPIRRTVANDNQGVTELVDTIYEHMTHLHNSGQLATRRTDRTKNEILELLQETIRRHILGVVKQQGNFDALVMQVTERKSDPYSVVQTMLAPIIK